MNYNAYSTSESSPEAIDTQREQEYRQELSNAIVTESIGTVGIYTSLDPSRTDRAQLMQMISERNPRGAEHTPPAGGGWQNWGERQLPTRTSLPPQMHEALLLADTTRHQDREEVRFVEMPDETVEVRYFYMAKGYQDGTGRPGNALNVGFTLSHNKATQLQQALEADPNFIDQVIKDQVTAVGISDDLWNARMKPRDSFRAPKEEALAITHASIDGTVATERFAYADRKAIAPTYEQAVPVEDESATLDAEAADHYEMMFNSALSLIDDLRTEGWTDEAIRAEFDEMREEAEQDSIRAQANAENNPREAKFRYANHAAYHNALVRFDEGVAAAVDQAELKQSQRSEVEAAQLEVANAFQVDVTPVHEVGSRVTLDGEDVRVIDLYHLQNNEQTPMAVVQDVEGRQKHVKAELLGR